MITADEILNEMGFGNRNGIKLPPRQLRGAVDPKDEKVKPYKDQIWRPNISVVKHKNDIDKNNAGATNVNIRLTGIDQKDVPVLMADKIMRPKEINSNNQIGVEYTVKEKIADKWIDNVLEKNVISKLAQSQNAMYDKFVLERLPELAKVSLQDVPTDEEYRNAEASLAEIEEKIFEALHSGDFSSVQELMDVRAKLQSRIYGHQLSHKNAIMIISQALKAGLTPSSPNWPTFVRSAYVWENEFKCHVVPNPKMRYIITSVYHGRSSSKASIDRNLKNKLGFDKGIDDVKDDTQIMDKAKMVGGIYDLGVAYDITDVEPNSGTLNDFLDKFYGQRGLKNNLNGALTDAALKDSEAYQEAVKQEKEQNGQQLDPEKEKLFKQEGEIQVYNDCLLDFAVKKGIRKTWQNTGNPANDYIANVRLLADDYVVRAKYGANPTNRAAITTMITVGVVSITIGPQYVAQAYGKHYVQVVFDSISEARDVVTSIVRSIYNGIISMFDSKYNTQQQQKQQAMVAESEGAPMLHTNNMSDDAIFNYLMTMFDIKTRN